MKRLIVLILCLVPTVHQAMASDKSKALNHQGAELLKAGDYAGALKLFREAQKADPKDAAAYFLQGVVLNRTPRDLGKLIVNPAEAYQVLNKARELGSDNRDLGFEIGWSLLKLQRWGAAIEELEAYEMAHPGRAKTSEFLGRAHMELGRLDRADQLFDLTIQRDTNLEPTVRVFRMELERRRGNPDKAIAHLRSLLNESPNSPVSSALRDALGGLQLEDVTIAKPWRLTLTAAGGWNSNVVAVGDGVPLPTDISAKSSAFGHLSLDYAYDLFRSETDSLTVGYFFTADQYESGVNNFDLIDHYLYGTYYKKLDSKWTFGLRLSDQFSNIGGDSFRNQLGVRPSLFYRVNKDWAAEIAYTYYAADYMTPTTAVSDRDAGSHTVLGSLSWDIPKTKMRLQSGVFHTINNAQGADYDYDRFGYFVGVHMPFIEKFDLDFAWTRTRDDYDNFNSFSGFAVAREDDVDVLSARFTRALDSKTSLFFQLSLIDDDSNITVFDYNQHTLMGGLVFKF
jgi:tetratricopeptide (TPR) repeat protein